MQETIICDLDGTLCLFEKEDKSKPHYRNPYESGRCGNDLLNEAVASVVGKYNVIFVSGREDKYMPETIDWLHKHKMVWKALYMRKSGDNRKDSIVKEEIYKTKIEPNYDIKFVLDDRNQVVEMWRSLGLVCFQVAPGNF